MAVRMHTAKKRKRKLKNKKFARVIPSIASTIHLELKERVFFCSWFVPRGVL
jgi:hypothetical protein